MKRLITAVAAIIWAGGSLAWGALAVDGPIESAPLSIAMPTIAMPAPDAQISAPLPSLPAVAVPAVVPAPATPAAAAMGQAAGMEQALSQPHAAAPEQTLGHAYDNAGAPSGSAVSASAEPAPAPEPGTPLPVFQSEMVRVLDHLAATPLRRERMSDRVQDVISRRGIPYRVKDGWFSSHIETAPLDPEVLAVLPSLRDVARQIEQAPLREQWGSIQAQQVNALSDLLYSIGVLTKRSPTKAKLLEEYQWLWGTYRLGRPS